MKRLDYVTTPLAIVVFIAVGMITQAQAPPIYLPQGRRLTQQNLAIASPTQLVGQPDQNAYNNALQACLNPNPMPNPAPTQAGCQIVAQNAQASDLANRANAALVALCNVNTAQCDAILTTNNLWIKVN